MPPPATKFKNWFNDDLDSTGYMQEMCLCQAFKAVMFCLAEMDSNKESARQRASDALVLKAKAFQESRNTRIQGRFGFKAAEKMRAEAAAGLLTSRQEQILKESELETDMAGARRRYRIIEAVLEARKEKRDFPSSSSVQAPSKGGAGQKKEKLWKPNKSNRMDKSESGSSNELTKTTEKKLQPVQIIGGRTVLFSKARKEIGGGDLIRNGVQAMWKSRRERETFKKVVQKWSQANKRGAQKSLQGFVGGTDEDRNSGGDKAGRSQTQEQRIPDQEKERNMEADLRLSSFECSGPQNAFQMRQRENSGENIAGRRLGSDDRPSSGILSSPSFKGSQAMSCFQISQKRLQIQMNDFRIR